MNNCSVIMVSYHTGAVLFHAIARVLSQAGLAELIVVDNGNPPEVLERLRAMPQVKLITGHGNAGFAKGCNLGARHAAAEYVLLLNPDCLPQENAIAQLTAALAQPGAMMTGCLLQNADGTEQRGSRRQLLTPVTALSESFSLHRILRLKRLNEHETQTPQTTCEVPAISGACMCLRRADYEHLGGMDEGYFLHVEDLDFCWRVRHSGGKIFFVPEARVVHLLSTSDAAPPFIEWCKARGFMRYFHKHFADQYPTVLLWLADTGILIRFALKVMFPRRRDPQAASAGKKLLLLLAAKEKPATYDLRGKTIVLLGATSPLGAIITGQLLAAGAKVTAVSRQDYFPLPIENLAWLKADIGRPGFTLPGGAELLIHCAPLWTLPGALEALAKAGITRAVAFGSTSLFGKDSSPNAAEQKVVAELREAEALIAERCHIFGIAYTILRPTMIYGTGLDGNVSRIARTIRRFDWLPVLPPASGLRQPVHAEDLAHAAINALQSDAATDNAYNLSGGETLSYRAMAERIFRTMEKPVRIVPLPGLPLVLDAMGHLLHNSNVNGAMAERMNMDLAFPHDEAAQDFGYTPRTFLSGGMADLTGP